jgi:hypothetical protein
MLAQQQLTSRTTVVLFCNPWKTHHSDESLARLRACSLRQRADHSLKTIWLNTVDMRDLLFWELVTNVICCCAVREAVVMVMGCFETG